MKRVIQRWIFKLRRPGPHLKWIYCCTDDGDGSWQAFIQTRAGYAVVDIHDDGHICCLTRKDGFDCHNVPYDAKVISTEDY